MPEAARKGDIAKGHDCFPDSPIIEGSPNVFINGQPAARLGDAAAPHSCTCGNGCETHSRTLAEGAPTVFINGRPAGTVGCSVTCGGVVISGSNNVFIGNGFSRASGDDSARGTAPESASAQSHLTQQEAEQHAQAAKKARPEDMPEQPAQGNEDAPPEPLPLPALIYQTQNQMDDYQAKDMHHGDLSADELKQQFNLTDISTKVDPYTLALLSPLSFNPYGGFYPGSLMEESTPPIISRDESARLMFDEFRELAKVLSF